MVECQIFRKSIAQYLACTIDDISLDINHEVTETVEILQVNSP